MEKEIISIYNKFYVKYAIIELNKYLYILSDEEIKEGDWYYSRAINGIFQALAFPLSLKDARKIIATTDPALEINTKLVYSHAYVNLPRPSNAFLEAYVREYNKRNEIKEVLVEMEEVYYPDHWYMEPNKPFENVYKLKVAPDNTITIKPVKEEKPDIQVLASILSLLEVGNVTVKFNSNAHKDLLSLYNYLKSASYEKD